MRLSKTKRSHSVIFNLTPMIDIVFLLIIFFMVGTRFSELSEAERNIELNVPEVQQAGALTTPPQKRQINVFKNGSVTLDDVPVSLQQLQSELSDAQQQFKGLGVIVRGDSAAIYQHVADVLAVCRTAGIADLGISVRVAKRE